jgi:hypothetical protein
MSERKAQSDAGAARNTTDDSSIHADVIQDQFDVIRELVECQWTTAA